MIDRINRPLYPMDTVAYTHPGTPDIEEGYVLSVGASIRGSTWATVRFSDRDEVCASESLMLVERTGSSR